MFRISSMIYPLITALLLVCGSVNLWSSVNDPTDIVDYAEQVDWSKSGADVSKPTPFQVEFMMKLKKFDSAYNDWQTNKEADAQRWENLANNVFGVYEDMAAYGENGPFIMRGILIKAECLVFAAVDHMKSNRREEALEDYERGIKLLEDVILIHDLSPFIESGDLSIIPDYRKQVVVVPGIKNKMVHPYAGFETIGTGIITTLGLKGEEGQEVESTVSGRTYRTIDVLQKALIKDYETIYHEFPNRLTIPSHWDGRGTLIGYDQKSTAKTARDLLADFCPWGIVMYFNLKKAGLTEGLDCRILRPFAVEGTPTYAKPGLTVITEIYNKYQDIFYPENSLHVRYDVLPQISDSVLTSDQVPLRIKKEMNRIVGTQTAVDGQKIYRGVEGDLGGLTKKPIKWTWVGSPTYNIWYFSPRIYDWGTNDWLRLWFTAVKVYFGGPGGVIADELINLFKNHIDSTYGEGPVDVKFYSTIIVEQYDKEFLMPSVLEKKEWLSSAAIVRKVATPVFGGFAEQLRKDNYQGVDPKKLTMGTTYNETPIPPVMIRSSVLGFEEPEVDYPRFVEVVRFFSVYPEIKGNKEPHQKLILSGIFPVFLNSGWWKFPELGGSFEIITDFSPEKQILKFNIDEETSKFISDESTVHAEIWSIGPDNRRHYVARSLIKQGQSMFSFTLLNKNNPDARKDFEEKTGTRNVSAWGISSNAETWEKIGKAVRSQREAIEKGEWYYVLADVKTRYELKLLVDRVDTQKSYQVVLYKGRGNEKKITGQLSSPGPGVVRLDYEPEIEIPIARVSTGAVNNGRRRGE